MDNPSYQKDPEKGTELEAVNSLKNNNTNKSNPNQQPISCKPEVCRAAMQKNRRPDLADNNPWHLKKTIFLIGTIVLLVIWIIVYTTISELNLLWLW